MNTKEKLELIWKYLFLLVVAIGIFRFTDSRHAPIMKGHLGGHELMFFGDNENKMDVKVEKEIVNGDTIMKVMINGEEVDASKFNESNNKLKWISKDGEVHVIKMSGEAEILGESGNIEIIIDVDDKNLHENKSNKMMHKKIIKRKIK